MPQITDTQSEDQSEEIACALACYNHAFDIGVTEQVVVNGSQVSDDYESDEFVDVSELVAILRQWSHSYSLRPALAAQLGESYVPNGSELGTEPAEELAEDLISAFDFGTFEFHGFDLCRLARQQVAQAVAARIENLRRV